MHKIYEDDGKYNILCMLPYTCYSAIIAIAILRIITETLIITEKHMLELKRQNTKMLALEQKRKSLKCIMIKYIIFFVLCAGLITFFWIYLTCFEAIYQNTQMHLIKNTLLSFAISSVYPFLICILPTILRKDALTSDKKIVTLKSKGRKVSSFKIILKNREYVYNASKYLQYL